MNSTYLVQLSSEAAQCLGNLWILVKCNKHKQTSKAMLHRLHCENHWYKLPWHSLIQYINISNTVILDFLLSVVPCLFESSISTWSKKISENSLRIRQAVPKIQLHLDGKGSLNSVQDTFKKKKKKVVIIEGLKKEGD